MTILGLTPGQWLSLIIGGALFLGMVVIWVAGTVSNWMTMMPGNRASMTPVLPGLCGCVLLAALPLELHPALILLPLLVDPGCALLLGASLFSRTKGPQPLDEENTNEGSTTSDATGSTAGVDGDRAADREPVDTGRRSGSD